MKNIKLPPKEAFKIYKKICEIMEIVRTSTAALGQLFWQISINGDYKTILGDSDGTIDQFIADPKISKSYVQFNRMVKNHEHYIEKLDCKLSDLYGLDSHRLYEARGKTDKENVFEWLQKVKEFSRSAFKEELKFGDKDQMSCKHGGRKKVYPQKTRCEICGVFLK